MIGIEKAKIIENIIQKYKSIKYRIINNTLGKNLILLSVKTESYSELIKELNNNELKKYIQEIIIERIGSNENDTYFINEIKKICSENSIIHRNISYINWNDRSENKCNSSDKIFYNVISGYSFKGGMGRSKTLAYLAYFYALSGKKIVALDCDFEAPGLANIFFEKQEREKVSGILDYFVDLNVESELSLDNYYLQEGNLYIFPSGIDCDIKNYINKISKINFNSTSYFNKIIKLLDNINQQIKPDLIFIDLRAGINESNGIFLKKLSNMNLMFFNSEEQNKAGLQVVLNVFENKKNKPIIMNSTIRYQFPDERRNREAKLESYLKNNKFKIESIVSVKYKSEMLESSIEDFKIFVNREQKDYNPTYVSGGTFTSTFDDNLFFTPYISSAMIKINNKFFEKGDILRALEKKFSDCANLSNTLDIKEFIMTQVKGCLSDEDLFKVNLLDIENKYDFYEAIFGRKNKGKPIKFKGKNIKYNNVIEFMKSVIETELHLSENLYENIETWKNKHLFMLTSNGSKYKKHWNNISLST